MAIDLSKLKASMKSLEEKTRESLSSQPQESSKFFRLNMDPETKQGAAVLRFLPQKDFDAVPWVEYYHHWFVGPTGERYTELSATTWNESDLIGMYNKWLWENGHQDQARKQSRKKKFYANVYVVKGTPEQTGKVFIYNYGVKIHDLIKDCINPLPESGDEPRNPFDVFNGVNFRLKSYKQGDFVSYDKSTFDQIPAPLSDDEEKIAEILEQVYDLSGLIDKSKFPDTEQQLKKLNKVFGNDPLWVQFKQEAGIESPKVSTSNTSTVQESVQSVSGNEPSTVENTDDSLAGLDPEVAALLKQAGA